MRLGKPPLIVEAKEREWAITIYN